MNKSELIDGVAASTGLTKANAEKAVNAVIENITNTLKKGESVTLVGFGTFKITERQARKGRNPATGATIDIPASKKPGFVAGKSLKDAVK